MADTTTVKSDQINAADLVGGPITVTIDRVNIDLSQDQPVAIRLVGMEKVYRPCKIMRRTMMDMWGPDASQYVGRSMTLYCDPSVRFGKDKPGGTRISHMSHINEEKIVTLMVAKGKFAAHRITPLSTQDAKPAPAAASVAADAPGIDYTGLAKSAARKGKDAFVMWWNSDQGKDGRAAGLTVTEEIKAIIADADKAASEADNPFGLPPITPTQAEIDAAMAEAARAASEVAE
jgi:hypothetical protein